MLCWNSDTRWTTLSHSWTTACVAQSMTYAACDASCIIFLPSVLQLHISFKYDQLFICCLMSQQHASVSQGRICSDNFTRCHTEIEVAGQTFHLTQSQYTGIAPTSPSTRPITPGAKQGSHWSANFWVTGMTRPRKKSQRKRDSNLGSSAVEADVLTTRSTRR